MAKTKRGRKKKPGPKPKRLKIAGEPFAAIRGLFAKDGSSRPEPRSQPKRA
jgi:hypothetical protein